MSKHAIWILLLMLGCCGCWQGQRRAERSATDLSIMEQISWVIGEWESQSGNTQLHEVWTRVNDTLYLGKSFMLAGSDTVFAESIRLEQVNNQLHYTPTVRDQNGGMPVTFTLTSGQSPELVFENPNHDFPQRIIYANPTPDSLHARIEGLENGIFRKVEFLMHRSAQLPPD